MSRVKLPSNPSRRKMVKAISAEFKRLSKQLAPHLVAFPADQAAVIVGQNVLRDCLSALFSELIPFSPEDAVDLARRGASFALSVIPMEDQDVAMSDFLTGFADFHLERTARGHIIESQCQMDDGIIRPNFPIEAQS